MNIYLALTINRKISFFPTTSGYNAGPAQDDGPIVFPAGQ